MLQTLRDDIQCVLERDPAASHWLPVLLFWPGLHAVQAHRLAHALWQRGWTLPALFVASLARFFTGIEIHPGATIGARFFIDHGMGVVIGETADIGADVTLYHGVTLGGVSLKRGKRHPTIEDGVVIGAGAKVLGAITVGRNTRIGANAVVVKDIPAEQIVVGVPGRAIGDDRSRHQPDFDHDNLPDVVVRQLEDMRARLDELESRMDENNYMSV
jgi:serine O-acetyltransferase